jgi:hypothetical protein
MKKLLVFSLFIVMVSCKSDAEKKPTVGAKLMEVQPNDQNLFDSWIIEGQKLDGKIATVAKKTEVTFYKNKTFKGFNGNIFNFEIEKDSLLLYSGKSSKPEKSQLLYINESKNSIQLTAKLADGRVVQTQLRRKGTN